MESRYGSVGFQPAHDPVLRVDAGWKPTLPYERNTRQIAQLQRHHTGFVL